MKKTTLLIPAFSALLISFTSIAQVSVPPERAVSKGENPGSSTTVKCYSKLGETMSNIGKVYGQAEIMRMPHSSINNIANTVVGVDSRNGAVPHIRGAGPEGTAYFVDGVRVYGALPK